MRILKTAQLIIDVEQRLVTTENKKVELSPLSYDLLLLLIQSAPKLITIEQIIDLVWQTNVSDETVTQRIALIRKSLKNVGITEKCIESVRGQGYRWLPKVSLLNQRVQKSNKTWLWATLVLTITLSVSLYYFFSNRNPSNSDNKTKSQAQEYIKQARFYLAKFDANSNQIAIDLFQQAQLIEPNNLAALIGLSNAYSHQITKYNANDPKLATQANQLATLATQLDENNAKAWSALGFAYDATGDTKAAIDNYQKSLELAPDNRATLASLAYLKMVTGDLVGSLRLNLQAFDGSQQYRYLQIAQLLELLDYKEQANNWYQKALTYSPDSIFAASTYANFLFSQGNFLQANKVSQQAIDKQIPQADLFLVQSLIALNQQNYSRAEELIKQSLSLNSNYKAEKWLAYLEFKTSNEPSILLKKLNLLIEENNSEISWPSTYIDFAVIKSLHGDKSQAFHFITKAIELGFRNKSYLQQIGQIMNWQQNPEFLQNLNHISQLIERDRKTLNQQDWLPKNLLE